MRADAAIRCEPWFTICSKSLKRLCSGLGEGLADARAQSRIAGRIARVRLGLLGDAHSVGGGVSELRLDHGPGYRIYLARRGRTVLILLCGGDKGSQKRDIRRAQDMASQIGDLHAD